MRWYLVVRDSSWWYLVVWGGIGWYLLVVFTGEPYTRPAHLRLKRVELEKRAEVEASKDYEASVHRVPPKPTVELPF